MFGYPLAGALSSTGNTSYLEISAAVQPGNSGGAAVDESSASVLEAHNVAYQADTVTRELSNTQRAEASSAQLECRK